MAWTAPRTWITSEVPTAAQLNAHIRDNELVLYQAFTGEVVETLASSDNTTFALAANEARFSLFTVPRLITITAVHVRIGTSSGNIDIGIYPFDFASRSWSRGSVVCPAAGLQSILISAGSPTTLSLAPGAYWFAFVPDNAVMTRGGQVERSFATSKYVNAGFPLPASIASPLPATSHAPWAAFIQ